MSPLLRVRGLPDAPQFIRLDSSVAGELQQPLDIEEYGGPVVGKRKLHLPGCTQPSHLNTQTGQIQQLFSKNIHAIKEKDKWYKTEYVPKIILVPINFHFKCNMRVFFVCLFVKSTTMAIFAQHCKNLRIQTCLNIVTILWSHRQTDRLGKRKSILWMNHQWQLGKELTVSYKIYSVFCWLNWNNYFKGKKNHFIWAPSNLSYLKGESEVRRGSTLHLLLNLGSRSPWTKGDRETPF